MNSYLYDLPEDACLLDEEIDEEHEAMVRRTRPETCTSWYKVTRSMRLDELDECEY